MAPAVPSLFFTRGKQSRGSAPGLAWFSQKVALSESKRQKNEQIWCVKRSLNHISISRNGAEPVKGNPLTFEAAGISEYLSPTRKSEDRVL